MGAPICQRRCIFLDTSVETVVEGRGTKNGPREQLAHAAQFREFRIRTTLHPGESPHLRKAALRARPEDRRVDTVKYCESQS